MIAFLLLAATALQTPSAQAPPGQIAPGQIAPTAPVMTRYGGVALSPDASLVASVDKLGESHGRLVLRQALDGKVVRTLDPCDHCEYGAPAWSPDGSRLAFVASDRLNTRSALYSVAVRDAAPPGAPATTLNGLMAAPRWAPDGRTLAVLATADPHKQTGATQAGAARVGEIGAETDEQRVAVVPAAGGALRFVSPTDTFVYEYDWTPDGQGFVGTAAKGDGDDNWWVAKLEAFPLAGGERVIAAPKVQMNAPRVSPDGRTVVFIGGLMSDFGSVGGDLYATPVAGGEPKNLTPGFKGSFNGLAWRGGTVRATALVSDHFAVVEVDPTKGVASVKDGPSSSFSAADGHISLSADGRTAAAAIQDFTHAPRIYVHGPAGPRQITHDNDALAAHVVARSITWTHDGFTGQGWLQTPIDPPAGRKLPMVVLVHGGPSAAAVPGYVVDGPVRQLVDRGYAVFEPNPRGSYGQGEAYTAANRRDFGGGDLSDILAGVDAAEKASPIDDARLGVMGFSYGGFMTMWAVTHTDRFKAAVSGAGLSNWSSYYGENGIDQWMIPFFGKSFYEDPEIYDKLSPIRYVKAAKTPTFIFVGERDVECPPGQSIEFWHGLKAYDVPTSLVIYEGEGHGIRRPDHTADSNRRILAWFDKYLAPAPLH